MPSVTAQAWTTNDGCMYTSQIQRGSYLTSHQTLLYDCAIQHSLGLLPAILVGPGLWSGISFSLTHANFLDL